MATPKFMQKVQDTHDRLSKRGGGSNSKKVQYVDFPRGKDAEPVTYKLRLIPSKDENSPPWREYQICKWVGPNKKFIVPRAQYGLKPCPISEYLDGLARKSDKASKDEYKDSKPKLQFTMFVINREAEDLGPLRLDLNQVAVQDLIAFFMDADYGDLSDIEEGRDFTIEYTPASQTQSGFPTYKIIPRPRCTHLSDDPELIAAWTEKDLFAEYGVGWPSTVEFAQAAIDGTAKTFKGAYVTMPDGSPDPRWEDRADNNSEDEFDDAEDEKAVKEARKPRNAQAEEPADEPEQESNPDLNDEEAELAKIRARKAAAQSAPKGPSATDRIRASLKGKK